MADLIDRQALGVGRCSPDVLPAAYCAGWNGLVNLINKAPAVDAVEVVRCKACKYWEARYNGKAGFCPKRKGIAMANDFCSYGERREENAAD